MLMPDACRLPVLYDAIRDLGASLDLPDVLDQVTSAAIRLMGAGQCFITLLDGACAGQRFRAASDSAPEIIEQAAKVMDSLAREVAQTRQAILIPDARGEPRLADVFAARTMIVAPLQAPDEIVGALCVDRGAPCAPFTADDLAVFEAFARQAAMAIRNAQRYEAMKNASAKFIETLTHDLRSPLTIIWGYADLLRNGKAGPMNDEQIKFLTVVCNGVKKANLLLDGLGTNHDEGPIVSSQHESP